MSPDQRSAIKSYIQEYASVAIQDALTDAVTGTLPSVPIPSFRIPDEYSRFGLPAPRSLGLTFAESRSTGGRVTLRGSFGLIAPQLNLGTIPTPTACGGTCNNDLECPVG